MFKIFPKKDIPNPSQARGQVAETAMNRALFAQDSSIFQWADNGLLQEFYDSLSTPRWPQWHVPSDENSEEERRRHENMRILPGLLDIRRNYLYCANNCKYMYLQYTYTYIYIYTCIWYNHPEWYIKCSGPSLCGLARKPQLQRPQVFHCSVFCQLSGRFGPTALAVPPTPSLPLRLSVTLVRSDSLIENAILNGWDVSIQKGRMDEYVWSIFWMDQFGCNLLFSSWDFCRRLWNPHISPRFKAFHTKDHWKPLYGSFDSLWVYPRCFIFSHFLPCQPFYHCM